MSISKPAQRQLWVLQVHSLSAVEVIFRSICEDLLEQSTKQKTLPNPLKHSVPQMYADTFNRSMAGAVNSI